MAAPAGGALTRQLREPPEAIENGKMESSRRL